MTGTLSNRDLFITAIKETFAEIKRIGAALPQTATSADDFYALMTKRVKEVEVFAQDIEIAMISARNEGHRDGFAVVTQRHKENLNEIYGKFGNGASSRYVSSSFKPSYDSAKKAAQSSDMRIEMFDIDGDDAVVNLARARTTSFFEKPLAVPVSTPLNDKDMIVELRGNKWFHNGEELSPEAIHDLAARGVAVKAKPADADSAGVPPKHGKIIQVQDATPEELTRLCEVLQHSAIRFLDANEFTVRDNTEYAIFQGWNPGRASAMADAFSSFSPPVLVIASITQALINTETWTPMFVARFNGQTALLHASEMVKFTR